MFVMVFPKYTDTAALVQTGPGRSSHAWSVDRSAAIDAGTGTGCTESDAWCDTYPRCTRPGARYDTNAWCAGAWTRYASFRDAR